MANSYRHKKDTRPHTPSQEEAGMELDNQQVHEKAFHTLPLNPVVNRGQDPELFWMNKYGPADDRDEMDIEMRSLYRHEHISPEILLKNLYSASQPDAVQGNLFDPKPDVRDLFGNQFDMDELDKVGQYYSHQNSWSNRLIQGDSLLAMSSLVGREGFAGKVQMVYFDPPYGIKYGSNWQTKMHDRDVKDGSDEHLSREPEQVKAFRDTWELGIHSYLTYLRERLLIARELLTESGSCFVQISDENVHLVRCLMDEVFGSGNFAGQICFAKTSAFATNLLSRSHDYILWFAKKIEIIKFNQLYLPRVERTEGGTFNWIELNSGISKRLSAADKESDTSSIGRKFRASDLTSSGESKTGSPSFEFEGELYNPAKGNHWKTTIEGLKKLAFQNRIIKNGKNVAYKRFEDDFPYMVLSDVWEDTIIGTFSDKWYVVQTASLPIERCLLMTTDPGDLVLDPTCGSGTTAYVAEQWGRRWITLDTSRIALHIAKTRLMTAVFPYYHLHADSDVLREEKGGKITKKVAPKPAIEQTNDVRQGFVYEEVPHITLKSLANDEPPSTETLYDRPFVDKTRLRVAGPFTVETLQSDEAVPPSNLGEAAPSEDGGNFEEEIFAHLRSAGIKNGIKNEMAVFERLERLAGPFLHAEGFYQTAERGERKAYFLIGPRFGSVAKTAVNEAIKECRSRGDADWLVILGFAFEDAVLNESVTQKVGAFEVTKVRMHDDLLQAGFTKKNNKKAASFMTIGEPDAVFITNNQSTNNQSPTVQVELRGMDLYNPLRDTVTNRSVRDISYWMLDDDYDGSNFIVRQVFFCGGQSTEYEKVRRGLTELTKQKTKSTVERFLKIEIDDEAFGRVYGNISHPILAVKGKKVAIRAISQTGEESLRVLEI